MMVHDRSVVVVGAVSSNAVEAQVVSALHTRFTRAVGALASYWVSGSQLVWPSQIRSVVKVDGAISKLPPVQSDTAWHCRSESGRHRCRSNEYPKTQRVHPVHSRFEVPVGSRTE